MNISVSNTKDEMGEKAAETGSELIQKAISRNGRTSIILATGASQFEMLKHLVHDERIDWTKVTAFHLDEYIGIPVTPELPASILQNILIAIYSLIRNQLKN